MSGRQKKPQRLERIAVKKIVVQKDLKEIEYILVKRFERTSLGKGLVGASYALVRKDKGMTVRLAFKHVPNGVQVSATSASSLSNALAFVISLLFIMPVIVTLSLFFWGEAAAALIGMGTIFFVGYTIYRYHSGQNSFTNEIFNALENEGVRIQGHAAYSQGQTHRFPVGAGYSSPPPSVVNTLIQETVVPKMSGEELMKKQQLVRTHLPSAVSIHVPSHIDSDSFAEIFVKLENRTSEILEDICIDLSDVEEYFQVAGNVVVKSLRPGMLLEHTIRIKPVFQRGSFPINISIRSQGIVLTREHTIKVGGTELY